LSCKQICKWIQENNNDSASSPDVYAAAHDVADEAMLMGTRLQQAAGWQ
jgi:hypothetical protein